VTAALADAMAAQVRFMSIVSHMHVDEDHEPPPMFYQLLQNDYRLANVIQVRAGSGRAALCEAHACVG
jgi:hypothetical protein